MTCPMDKVKVTSYRLEKLILTHDCFSVRDRARVAMNCMMFA